MSQFKQYLFLMRLNKPIGILLLLWPALWTLWLSASGKPNPEVVCIFIVGVILMRSAGCIINDFADRHFDGHVARTQNRPLATGQISSKAALSLFCILLLAAFCAVLPLNRLTIELACVGAVLTLFYPFMKRFTHLPQLGLGLAFAWSVPMAFAAQLGEVPWQAWIVFLAAAVWPVIYDTMYAMVDQPDDIKIGVKSTAILWGKFTPLVVCLLQIVFVVLLLIVGFIFHLNWLYFTSLVGVFFLCIYQQALLYSHSTEQFFKAFLNNHWIGLIVFLGIFLGYMG